MKPAPRKFFLALFFAFVLLLATYMVYARHKNQEIKEQKKPVAVCGKTDKT